MVKLPSTPAVNDAVASLVKLGALTTGVMDALSALASRRVPSVDASQKSPRASLDGGKKFRKIDFSPRTTSGSPELQCATTVEPSLGVAGSLR